MLLERSYQEVDTNFRSYSRAILGIGCNLHRSRELRFFFLELVERCIEPWKQVNWSHTDLRNFLSVYMQCALDMDVLRYEYLSLNILQMQNFCNIEKYLLFFVFREIEIRDAFERYMTVVTCCLLRMYHT